MCTASRCHHLLARLLTGHSRHSHVSFLSSQAARLHTAAAKLLALGHPGATGKLKKRWADLDISGTGKVWCGVVCEWEGGGGGVGGRAGLK